jgi:hypothetical protein
MGKRKKKALLITTYMELGSYFLFLQEQINDNIINDRVTVYTYLKERSLAFA